jgi:hypothetical protein
MATRLDGLHEFGLTTASLRALGERPVRLRVSFAWPELTSRFLRLRPAERKAEMDRRKREGLRRARSRWPDCGVERDGSTRAPHGFEVTLPARAAERLARDKSYSFVYLESVQGRRKHRQRPRKPRMEWYAVRGQVAVQVEGQTRGIQGVEDRIVLVKALDFDDAVLRLKREWVRYARPYLNPYGQRVRWQLEEIVDVYSTMERELDPRGVEVYSKLTGRKMTRSREWHPERGRR